jgi:hypothetical protein
MIFGKILKSIAEVGPVKCGLNYSSAFVVSCGEFLVFLGSISVFGRKASGFGEPQGDFRVAKMWTKRGQ